MHMKRKLSQILYSCCSDLNILIIISDMHMKCKLSQILYSCCSHLNILKIIYDGNGRRAKNAIKTVGAFILRRWIGLIKHATRIRNARMNRQMMQFWVGINVYPLIKRWVCCAATAAPRVRKMFKQNVLWHLCRQVLCD